MQQEFHSNDAQIQTHRSKGFFDLRGEWVRELRNSKRVAAVKVDTEKNIADMMTRCLCSVYELQSVRD